jgi:predicted nucleotidyltransferase component of viral defense system
VSVNNSESILARLRNRAKEENITMQQLLNLFFQEEFLRRLSNSRYKDNLILKGGFFLYTISDFKFRPTIDSDYLIRNHSNDIKEIENLVHEIIGTDMQDEIIGIEVSKLEIISEIREYHGVRAKLIGYIGRTRTPFHVDFGIGDIIVPGSVEREIPVLLAGFDKPKVLTYSLESTIAEKLDAIITLMEATGRMKDFYDIYQLAKTFDFEGDILRLAVEETLNNRNTNYDKDSVIIISRLVKDMEIQKRWVNFVEKVIRDEVDFERVVKVILKLLSPPFEAIVEGKDFNSKWSCKEERYL